MAESIVSLGAPAGKRQESKRKELIDDGYCFACGPNNPIGLRMKVVYENGQAACMLCLSRELQGWNGIVHGGVVAAILDEVMAHAVTHFVAKAVTTSLQITYRSPVPVGRSVRAVGHIMEHKRRSVVARGELFLEENGQLLAEGESRFLLLP